MDRVVYLLNLGEKRVLTIQMKPTEQHLMRYRSLCCTEWFECMKPQCVTGLDTFSKPVEKHFNLPNHSKQQIWHSAAFPYQCPTSRKHGKRKISKTKNILF